MKNNNHIPDSTDTLWTILLSTIYIMVICVVVTLGYLLLQDQIHAYFNQKIYTEEELVKISKRGMVKQSLEQEEANWDRVSNGIHVRTGFHDDPSLNIVIGACTSCHSAKLITQNRATREGWKSMIDWMQETQGLQDLGTSEPVILDYLAKYYAPKESGRRENLDVKEIDWYVLNLEES